MTAMKINKAPSLLASEYVVQKKLDLQNKKAANKQTRAEASTEDVVSLSSNQPDAQEAPSRLPASQPVNVKEKQALKSTFSVLA